MLQDNADVSPLIPTVISANMNPETEGEACLDRLVATTYVSAVDEPTLSIIIPVLLRGLRVKGNVNMVRKAAIVTDTMFKLVNNPADIAAFAPDLIPDLARNAEEISIPEIRAKNEEALNTVKVTLGHATQHETTPLYTTPIPIPTHLHAPHPGPDHEPDPAPIPPMPCHAIPPHHIRAHP